MAVSGPEGDLHDSNSVCSVRDHRNQPEGSVELVGVGFIGLSISAEGNNGIVTAEGLTCNRGG